MLMKSLHRVLIVLRSQANPKLPCPREAKTTQTEAGIKRPISTSVFKLPRRTQNVLIPSKDSSQKPLPPFQQKTLLLPLLVSTLSSNPVRSTSKIFLECVHFSMNQSPTWSGLSWHLIQLPRGTPTLTYAFWKATCIKLTISEFPPILHHPQDKHWICFMATGGLSLSSRLTSQHPLALMLTPATQACWTSPEC